MKTTVIGIIIAIEYVFHYFEATITLKVSRAQVPTSDTKFNLPNDGSVTVNSDFSNYVRVSFLVPDTLK